MRKIILLFLCYVGCCINMYAQQTASKTSQPLKLRVQQNERVIKIARAPIHLLIEAWYDPVELTVEIVAPKELEGEATLESQGMIVGYSKELNAVFTLPFEKGTYTLTIEGESWSAEGSFSL